MVIITKEEVDEIFANAKEQSDYVIALYKKVYPNWDKIEKVNGFPKSGRVLDLYIMEQAIKFDRSHYKDVMPGGLWMNNGFSGDSEGIIPDWEVQPCEVTLIPE